MHKAKLNTNITVGSQELGRAKSTRLKMRLSANIGKLCAIVIFVFALSSGTRSEAVPLRQERSPCPPDSPCHDDNRFGCEEGQCGGCFLGYTEVAGNCVLKTTDQEIKQELEDIRLIEKILEENERVWGHQGTDTDDDKRIEDGEREEEIEKAAELPDVALQSKKNEPPEEAVVHEHPPMPHAQVAKANLGAAETSSSGLPTTALIAIIAACAVAGVAGLVIAGVCFYRLNKRVKAASEVDYPAYGVTGPNKERPDNAGDRKLAQSAQMYHFQHQKQQMIAMERANSEMKHEGSDYDSEEEGEEGDYTVYECPGLAPTGEMEVQNPLFSEEAATSGLDDGIPGEPDIPK